MKYAVTTQFIFEGTFFVEAENKSRAKEYVEKRCGLVLGGGIHTTLSGEDANWDFPIHPEKTIAKVQKTGKR